MASPSILARRAEATRVLAGALLAGAAPGGPRPPGIVVVAGPGEGTSFHLEDGALLGRGRGAQLRLADPAASSLHLRFTVGPRGPAVEDVGSRNGATLNGRPLGPGAAPLAAGDEIGVGDSLLRVVDPCSDRDPGSDLDPELDPELDPDPDPDPGLRRPRAAALALAGALLCLSAALALAAG